MTYKELSPQEVAKMLSENGCFEGYIRDHENQKWQMDKITGTNLVAEYAILTGENHWKCCAIEIPDTYEAYEGKESNGLCCCDIVIYKKTGLKCEINTINNMNGHYETSVRVEPFSGRYFTNKELFKHFAHLDGSPIGRKVGE